MKRKSAQLLILLFSAVFVSQTAFASSNPFVQAMTLSNKYMRGAVISMWNSEHLSWRAQLFQAACTDDFTEINHEIAASFTLVHDKIIDQAILNGELITEDEKAALADMAKLHYKIYSSAYRYGYIYRLKVIQKHYPEINPEFCIDAEEMSENFPVDHAAMLPWRHTGNLRNEQWQDNIHAMRILNKYLLPAYLARQQQFNHLVDAQIYAMINDDKNSFAALAKVTTSQDYKNLLVAEVAKARELATNKKLPNSPWLAAYLTQAETWLWQAYAQSTISALQRIEEKYPKVHQKIEQHMDSYIELQRAELEADKARLKQQLDNI